MPRRKRASKSKVKLTLQGCLALMSMNRADLIRWFGSEATALAHWHAFRVDQLARGQEQPRLPPEWNAPRSSASWRPPPPDGGGQRAAS